MGVAENQLNIRLRSKLMLLIDLSCEKNIEIEYQKFINLKYPAIIIEEEPKRIWW